MFPGRDSIAFGNITTREENDLVEVTYLARRMVTRWSRVQGPSPFDLQQHGDTRQ